MEKKRVPIGTTIMLMIITATVTFTITVLMYQRSIESERLVLSEKYEMFYDLFVLDSVVRNNFVAGIDDDKLLDSILSGYVDGLGDAYSLYLNEEGYASITSDLAGVYGGIGIVVIYDTDNGYIRIIRVNENSPASEHDVRPGDYIVAVDGVDVKELGYYTAIAMMRGETGTEASFTIVRGGDTGNAIDFTITRALVESESVFAKVIRTDSGPVGYLQITTFDHNTFRAFEIKLAELLDSGVIGIVFDMRNNLGGELNAICNTIDMLVPEGPVIRVVDKDGEEEVRYSGASEVDIPMVVLINSNTYSAAELFAAALRDYDKAVLIGETTYGKGEMQTVISLGNGTAVYLSTHMYSPPYGDNYEGVGVAPDIEVILSEELAARYYDITDAEDVQLQAGISSIIEQAASAH